MKATLFRLRQVAFWVVVRMAHKVDFGWLLPLMARLPLRLGYTLSGLRGRINAETGRDWRSVALGTRHIYRQSMAGFAQLPGSHSVEVTRQWVEQRFETEARDEFEAQLVAARRLDHLSCRFVPARAEQLCSNRRRGLVLLTPHFDSFYLGIAFLAQASGARINSMSSAVTQDSRVDPAVGRHFDRKYRGLEHYLNGGMVLDIEAGLRPFYRMLQNHETLVVLGDAPVLPNGASMTVDFLGAQRLIAAGALRLAQRSGSDLGGYVCRYLEQGRYELEMCPAGPSDDPETIGRIYRFFSAQILAQPGLWWAADLLPNIPPVPREWGRTESTNESS
jgi:lauroyl/myristoyl acyltransferase